MSLVGSLHDLGLGEMLQIVSLGRKSGLLFLSCGERKAELHFRNGEVIRARSTELPVKLGEVLLRRGVVQPALLERALARQVAEEYRRQLGFILIDLGVSAPEIEAAVRGQIEKIVFGLFHWEEGRFEFEIREVDPGADNVRYDPLQFLLERGLNPQYLAMEGTRLLDEHRHRPFSQEEDPEEIDFAFNLVGEEPGPVTPPPKGRPLVLVDDDPGLRRVLEELLSARGFRVTPAENGEAALIAVDTLCASGERPALVVDLFMPCMDGSGSSGGVELLELVQNNFPDLTLIAASDAVGGEGVTGLKVPVLAKPNPAEEGELSLFVRSLERILCCTEAETGREVEPPQVADAADDVSGVPVPAPLLAPEEAVPPSLGGVVALALRFAARFVNRVVVLMVREGEIRGVGEAGVDRGDGLGAARVRALTLPRGVPSLFAGVIEARLACKGPLPQSRWNDYFLGELGGGRPIDAFAAPIMNGQQVVAVLYGDNLPEHRPVGATEALEVFLSQAGLAMEKALRQPS